MINMAKEECKLEGVKIYMLLRVTYPLFVDDVLLFCKGSLEEWIVYKEILDLFSDATCMVISEQKSICLEYAMEEGILLNIKNLFPFEIQSLHNGFKYLGYYLYPNNYYKEDWL